MENTGSHAKDELNTKTEDGRVLGKDFTVKWQDSSRC